MQQRLDTWRAAFGDAEFEFYRRAQSDMSPTQQSADEPSVYHAHFGYEVHFITRGRSRFLVGSRVRTLCAGEMLIIAPGMEHVSYIGHSAYENAVVAFRLKKGEGSEGFFAYFQQLLRRAAHQNLSASFRLIELARSIGKAEGQLSFAQQCREQLNAHAWLVTLMEELEHGESLRARPGEEAGGLHRSPGEERFGRRRLSEQELQTLAESVNQWNQGVTNIARELGFSVRTVERLIQEIYGEGLRSVRRRRMIDTVRDVMQGDGVQEMDRQYIAASFGYRSFEELIAHVERIGHDRHETQEAQEEKP